MEWKNDTEMPENGAFVLIFGGVFGGIHVGWYKDGVVYTVWSKDEKIKWEEVIKWMVIPEIPYGPQWLKNRVK